jgi:S1-C subfamily serine protease
VIAKVDGGYELLSAGHCTPANPKLPSDMTFSVADDMNGALTPVTLVASKMQEPIDWAVYYLKTNKKYPVIALGDERKTQINDKTIDVNFSMALAKEVSMGVISSSVQTDGEMKGFFQVTQFVSHGASGSSVVSEKQHAIIGIVIAGIDGATLPTCVEPISVIRMEISNLDVIHGGQTILNSNERGIPLRGPQS